MTSLWGCDKDVCSPFLFNVFFAAVTHAMEVRFFEDPYILRDLVHLEKDLEENVVGAISDTLTYVRKAVFDMLYAYDLEKCVQVGGRPCKDDDCHRDRFEAAGLTVSEKTETMLFRTADHAPRTALLVVQAAGQRYTQTRQVKYEDGFVHESAGIMSEIRRQFRLAWSNYSRFKQKLNDV